MLRNSTWRLDETNLANFGSDLEKQHRKEEGALETAWNYEGSPIGHEPGLWIWRVQNFTLLPVPKKQLGQFYQGDSYVILKTTQKKESDALVHNIHFWLVLNSLATQHREVQKYESSQFKSYFRTLTYLQGGFDSGFHHVEEEELHTRLLRVHRPSSLQGTRTQNAVVISEVALNASKQNTGGQKAFWDALGAAEEEQVNDTNDEDETTVESEREHRLLRLHSGLLGRLKLDVVAQGKISKDLFDSKDVFILDVSHEIFVWVGRDASRKERRHGLQYAQDYLKDSGLSPFTPICTLLEGAEDELFEAQLEGWQGW
ncbi:hypothetical protein BC941DRAFT_458319 [Chlamydoabsidia padenii]|nr:hypothetical protein BC941DRAFT_458319 [Chlamydoabsidia padenii]